MKPNPCSIPFYSTTNEKRTIDPSPSISRRRKEIWKTKNQEKKRWFCEFDLFICCTYTYMHTWYLLLYIHEVILSIISFSLKKKLRVLFLFFLPNDKSERKRKEKKRKVRAKKGKKRKEEEIRFTTYLPT